MFRNRSSLMLFLAIVSMVVLSCSVSFSTAPALTATIPASAVPTDPPTSIPSTPDFQTPVPLSQTPTPAPATNIVVQSKITPGVPSGPYAVVLVPLEDVLNIRSAAGVENPITGSFAPTSTNVRRTGLSAKVEDSVWFEIQAPGGGTGWVNANYLTEYVAPSDFCVNTQVSTLLNDIKSTMLTSNGQSLASLVSPGHGLDLRLWRYGTVANYDSDHARFLFDSTFQVNWGPMPGSGEDSIGSFKTAVLPKLTEVFGADYELHCNDTLDLATFSLVPWPPEYGNINFYAVHKLGSEIYGGMDWRTWLVGIEFIGGKPYLFSMTHFQWEP